jgi:hypothetical protein
MCIRDSRFRIWHEESREYLQNWESNKYDASMIIDTDAETQRVDVSELGCDCDPSAGGDCGGCIDVHVSYMVDGEDVIREDCTGIKSENNDLIYEFDQIRFTTFDPNGADTQHVGYVVWAEGMWMIWNSPDSEYFGSDGGYVLGHLEDCRVEIIGNKHQPAKDV